MKRSSDRQTTTDTPSARTFEISGRSLVALASSTAVTLPIATVVLHHQSIVLALLAGLVPALPLLLITAVLLSIYAAAALLTIVVVAIRIAWTRDDPAESLNSLFAWITNPPIAFMTGTPLKLPKRESKATSHKDIPQPLPAGAPGDARTQTTPFFDWLRREMAFEMGSAPQEVASDDGSVRGRHARSETVEPQPQSYDREWPLAA